MDQSLDAQDLRANRNTSVLEHVMATSIPIFVD